MKDPILLRVLISGNKDSLAEQAAILTEEEGNLEHINKAIEELKSLCKKNSDENGINLELITKIEELVNNLYH